MYSSLLFILDLIFYICIQYSLNIWCLIYPSANAKCYLLLLKDISNTLWTRIAAIIACLLVAPSVRSFNGLSLEALVIPHPLWQLNVPQIGAAPSRRIVIHIQCVEDSATRNAAIASARCYTVSDFTVITSAWGCENWYAHVCYVAQPVRSTGKFRVRSLGRVGPIDLSRILSIDLLASQMIPLLSIEWRAWWN